MKTVAHILWFAFVLLVGCAWPATARATPNFPAALAKDLGTAQVPPCSICHVCGVTGRGTVNTPWGAGMRARGLVLYDEASLAAAAAAMQKDAVSSRGDGVLDVDHLRKGEDPNPPGTCNPGADPTIPTYGCAGSVAPAAPSSSPYFFIVSALLMAAVLRRRVRRAGLGFAAALIFVAALSACASGNALTPRASEGRVVSAPKMASIRASTMESELSEAGLDPRNLPTFDALTHRQRRRVMSTFTRSLGFACTDCHNPVDNHVYARSKAITMHMWNEYARPYSLAKGAVYCDSCHQGQAKFLKRADRDNAELFMNENFVGKLQPHDKSEVECKRCHGDPVDLVILAKWKI